MLDKKEGHTEEGLLIAYPKDGVQPISSKGRRAKKGSLHAEEAPAPTGEMRFADDDDDGDLAVEEEPTRKGGKGKAKGRRAKDGEDDIIM